MLKPIKVLSYYFTSHNKKRLSLLYSNNLIGLSQFLIGKYDKFNWLSQQQNVIVNGHLR